MILNSFIKKENNSTAIYTTVLFFSLLSIHLTGCRFGDVVKNGSVEEISDAVKKGADVNQRIDSGETPLICAIQFNRNPYDSSLLLINSGADVNGTDERGTTPLHTAARTGNSAEALKLVNLLLTRGAKPDIHDGFDSRPPLMVASERTDGLPIAEILISKGANVKAQDLRGETVLHHAASVNNNREIIELLLKHGADINAGAPSFTPLHRAAYMGAAENVKVLISHNALINTRGNISDSKTPLETAVDMKHFDAAMILIESGADINTTSYYNYQPFRYRNNNQSYMNKLTHVDLDSIQFEKMTPLHRAVTHNSISFTDYLISKGAKMNIDAHFGGYPLDFAVFLNYYEIAELLIKHKAPMLFGELYLADAVNAGDLRKTELLLNAGTGTGRKDIYGNTPLHTASMNGYTGIVKLLIKHGADRGAKNNEGKTPSETASNEEIRDSILLKK